MNFEKILITTDFSEESMRAFDLSAYEAKMEGSQVTLLYVFDDFFIPPSVLGQMPNPNQIIEDTKKSSMKKLEELAEKYFGTHGIEVKAELVSTSEPPAHAIVDYATANNINLIVMSSHGKNGFQKLFIGSVVDKVVRLAKCPVLVIPKTES